MRALPRIRAAAFLLTGLASILPAVPAAAAESQPTGEWLTAKGLARIRIDDCGGTLWGITVWEREPGGVDSNNPNPAERNHPTLGLHILRAMKPATPGLWKGEVYNPVDGKTYDSKISLTSPDVLRIEGCVLGFLCGGEDWTRVKAETAAPQRPAAPQRSSKPKDTAPSACASLPTGPT
jgi:uncharacterized protein (DUF2147 family)